MIGQTARVLRFDMYVMHRLRDRQRAAAALTSILIVIIYILLRLPGIGVPLDRDEGTFGYLGQLINRGGLPYRDALDHKPPVSFYVNALALHFVPPTPQGIHTFLLVYNFLTLICLFFIAKLYFRSTAAGLCCAFAYAVFSASPAIHAFSALTEMYALLPTLLSLLLALMASRRDSSALILLSGAAGATACWTKQTAFTSVLFVFLFAVIASTRKFRHAALWIAGAVVLSGAILIAFYRQGVAHDFIYWCFTYDRTYATESLNKTAMRMHFVFGEIAAGDFLFPVAGAAIAIWYVVKRQPRGWFLLGFLILSFLGTLPGYTYPHYFVQLAPAVALAGGYAFFVLLRRFPHPATAVACAGVAIAIPVFTNSRYFLAADPVAVSREYFGINPFPESETAAQFLASASGENDSVLIVGSEPEILFYARRPSATSFIMVYPLTTRHARYREFQSRMWSELRQSLPKWVVTADNIPYSTGWGDLADPEVIGQLHEFLNHHYALVKRIPVAGTDYDDYDGPPSATRSISIFRLTGIPSSASALGTP
jgi:hypothetical protein